MYVKGNHVYDHEHVNIKAYNHFPF